MKDVALLDRAAEPPSSPDALPPGSSGGDAALDSSDQDSGLGTLLEWRDAPGSFDVHSIWVNYSTYLITSPSGLTCSDYVWTGTTLERSDLLQLLDRPEVVNALASAPAVFGLDTSGVVGSMKIITVARRSITLGAPCNGASGCVDAPSAVVELATLLQLVEDQGLSAPYSCHPATFCYASPDRGSCGASLTRFAYDPASGTCKQFTYSGCGGNDNRFATQRDCERSCSFDPCLYGTPTTGDAGAAIVVAGRAFSNPAAACGCVCLMSGRNPGCAEFHDAGSPSCR